MGALVSSGTPERKRARMKWETRLFIVFQSEGKTTPGRRHKPLKAAFAKPAKRRIAWSHRNFLLSQIWLQTHKVDIRRCQKHKQQHGHQTGVVTEQEDHVWPPPDWSQCSTAVQIRSMLAVFGLLHPPKNSKNTQQGTLSLQGGAITKPRGGYGF